MPNEDDAKGTRRGLLLPIAAGVFAVIALVLVVVIVRDRPKSSDAERTTISTTAARAAEAISSLDANDDGTFLRTLQELGTDPVVAQYQQFSSAAKEVMTHTKLQSIRGRSQQVWVGDLGGSQVSAIVRLDVVTVGETTRVNPDQYVEVSLAKLDGAWKVDNIQILNVSLSSGLPGVGSTTTTTVQSSG